MSLQACTLAQKYSLQVTAVEESLMEMLHPEGNIDAHWVSAAAGAAPAAETRGMWCVACDV